MRVEVIPYDFRVPEAEPLADLTTVREDFSQVLEVLAAMEEPAVHGVMNALWTAALTKYARPFATGILKWPQDVALEKLSEEELEFHHYVLDVRNGYIAHSIGSLEDYVPVVLIQIEENGSTAIRAIGCNHGRIVALSLHDRDALASMTAKLRDAVLALIEVEREKVLEVARSLPLQSIIDRGMWVSAVDSAKPRKNRKRLSRARPASA